MGIWPGCSVWLPDGLPTDPHGRRRSSCCTCATTFRPLPTLSRIFLQVATAWDVVGRRAEEFPAEARAEILARYPRQGFGSEFIACFEDQARRKPGGAAAASVAHNGADRIRANPLDTGA